MWHYHPLLSGIVNFSWTNAVDLDAPYWLYIIITKINLPDKLQVLYKNGI